MASEHEARRAADGTRAALGAWFTPADVVDGLLDLALDPLLAEVSAAGPEALPQLRVLDPACGDGNFLVAVGRRIESALVAAGWSAAAAARQAFGACVAGVDIDPEAVDACRAALVDAAGGHLAPHDVRDRVLVGDALALDPTTWSALADRPRSGGRPGIIAPNPERPDSPGAGGAGAPPAVDAHPFDLVVGNPPFLGRLRRRTAPDAASAAALRARFGSAAASYTDPAALFLLLATELAAAEGGRVALLLPVPVLASRDGRAVRDQVLVTTDLVDLWVAGEPVFDAAVDVCAVVLHRRAAANPSSRSEGDVDAAADSGAEEERGSVRLHLERAFAPAGQAPAPEPGAPTWSALLASAAGLPDRKLMTSGTLGDLAIATADFRDQYYGLAPGVVDAVEGGEGAPRLVTAGLIDPAHLAWGERSTRFAKSSWTHPRVRLDALSPGLQAWAARRLVPKVLVATQTRVLEPIVDAEGTLLPSVPVITVVLQPDAEAGGVPEIGAPAAAACLWHVGALLASPPITLLAARRHLGAGRNGQALRLRAADVLALPLPADRVAWDLGAIAFERASSASDAIARAADLDACAAAMLEAFGLAPDDALLDWWRSRLPRPR